MASCSMSAIGSVLTNCSMQTWTSTVGSRILQRFVSPVSFVCDVGGCFAPLMRVGAHFVSCACWFSPVPSWEDFPGFSVALNSPKTGLWNKFLPWNASLAKRRQTFWGHICFDVSYNSHATVLPCMNDLCVPPWADQSSRVQRNDPNHICQQRD